MFASISNEAWQPNAEGKEICIMNDSGTFLALMILLSPRVSLNNHRSSPDYVKIKKKQKFLIIGSLKIIYSSSY